MSMSNGNPAKVDLREEKLQQIIEKHNTRGRLRPILFEAQRLYGELPVAAHLKIAQAVGMLPVKLYGVTTFSPAGKNCYTNASDSFQTADRIENRQGGFRNIAGVVSETGYRALLQALAGKDSAGIVETVKKSGLRERDRTGEPVGLQWERVRREADEQKFICCYVSENDIGSVKDRMLIEQNPHLLLEAMAIAGLATGADTGYVLLNASWDLAAERLQAAIDEAKQLRFLGTHIDESAFSFEVEIRFSNEDVLFGEKTSLIAYLEGNRGEPAVFSGAMPCLWQKPVVIHNIETLYHIPAILLEEGQKPDDTVTGSDVRTKLFAVVGDLNHPGIMEIPLGTTLREVIFGMGGGIPGGKKLKAVQIGGMAGGCIAADQIDIPLDYESLHQLGLNMGSGGLVIMAEGYNIVAAAKNAMEFSAERSCGKCSPCRIGTKRMLEILRKIAAGAGEESDLTKLEILARNVKAASFCGFGRTAPDFVLSTLTLFRDEYRSYVINKNRNPAGGVNQ